MININKHKALILPNNNDIVWRYMNLERLINLLEYKSLFFCRADCFCDLFEGAIPIKEADYRIVEQENIANSFGKNFYKDKAEKNVNSLIDRHKKFKKACVINCWHINTNESDAMWKIYLKSDEGVAIKTTVKKIIKSCEKTPEKIYISKVRYIDYNKDVWYHPNEYPNKSYNFFTPLVHKRIEFKHESELRLLHFIEDAENDPNYWIKQKYEKGKMISVDLNDLIEEIIVPPYSGNNFTAKVKDLLLQFSINKIIRKSKLSEEPRY